MLNLKKQSGLTASFKDNVVIFGKGVISEPVTIRTLEEARPYLMDAKATSRRKNLYLMYRDPHREEDEDVFRNHHVRYDITVLFPGTIGGKKGEYIKTVGHTHPAPEIYEVLSGEATFVLQETKTTEETFVINATAGMKVLIPTGFSHVTVNTGTKPLILADLFDDRVKSDYSLLKKRRGAPYWVLPSSLGLQAGLTLAKNPSYTHKGIVSLGLPNRSETYGVPTDEPLYTAFINHPDTFAFLTDSKKATQIFKKGLLFEIKWSGILS